MKTALTITLLFLMEIVGAQDSPLPAAAPACDTSMIVVNAATFKQMIERKDGIIIDVRTPEEWSTGYIAGAVNIDFRARDFEKKIAKLDTSRTCYVYCEVGGRSRMAAGYMLSHGFCRVVVLQSGIRQWKINGYPVVTPGKTKE